METIRQVMAASVDSEVEVSSEESERSGAPSIKGEEEDVDMDLGRYSSHYAPSTAASESSWTGIGSVASGKTVASDNWELLSSKKRRRLSGKDDPISYAGKKILEEALGTSSRTGPLVPSDMAAFITGSITDWRAQTEDASVPGESFDAGPSSSTLGPSRIHGRDPEGHRGEYSAFSDDSDLESEISEGCATSTSSALDIVETGSTSGSSTLVDVDYDALGIYGDSDEPHAI